MKAVLISIRPKWCELIASGKKTIEVRKTRPKIETPFKVYIYQTLPKSGDWNDRDGHVIGEFVCIQLEPFTVGSLGSDEIQIKACLSYEELIRYFYKQEELDGNTLKLGYGWHISDLVIYDVPKQLSDFRLYYTSTVIEYGLPMPTYEIKRPPQSWIYVEELEGGNIHA